MMPLHPLLPWREEELPGLVAGSFEKESGQVTLPAFLCVSSV